MRYAIGIDLGGTNIAAGIVTEDYKLLEKGSVPTKAQRPWQEVAADMARLAMELGGKGGPFQGRLCGHRRGQPGHLQRRHRRGRLFQQPVLGRRAPLPHPDAPDGPALPPEQRRQLRCPGRGGRRARPKAAKQPYCSRWEQAWAAALSSTGRSMRGRPARAQSWATARSSPGAWNAPVGAGAASKAMPPPRLSSARLQRLRPRILKAC